MRLKNILILPALRLEVTAQIGPGVPLVRHHETGQVLPDPGRQLGRGHRFAMPVDEGGRPLPHSSLGTGTTSACATAG